MQAALPEHPDNGVERGLVDTQAIVLAAKRLDELASRWPESRYLNVAVLRALLSLVQRDPERAHVGFDAWEVAAAVRDEYVRGWAANDLREEVAAKVREHWQKLIGQTWPKKEEGVRQHLQGAGIEFMPVLSRDEGGGKVIRRVTALPWSRLKLRIVASMKNVRLNRSTGRFQMYRYACRLLGSRSAISART